MYRLTTQGRDGEIVAVRSAVGRGETDRLLARWLCRPMLAHGYGDAHTEQRTRCLTNPEIGEVADALGLNSQQRVKLAHRTLFCRIDEESTGRYWTPPYAAFRALEAALRWGQPMTAEAAELDKQLWDRAHLLA